MHVRLPGDVAMGPRRLPTPAINVRTTNDDKTATGGLQWHRKSQAGYLGLSNRLRPLHAAFSVDGGRLDDSQWHMIEVERSSQRVRVMPDCLLSLVSSLWVAVVSFEFFLCILHMK